MGHHSGRVEVRLGEGEPLAAAYSFFAPLELVDAHVYAGLGQTPESTLHAFLINQVLQVAALAARGPQELLVWAAGLVIDPIHHLQQPFRPRLEATLDSGPCLFQSDRAAQEARQVAGEPRQHNHVAPGPLGPACGPRQHSPESVDTGKGF